MPRKQCGATCRRTGNPCRSPAMANGRCRLHGGKCKAPGPDHPNWTNGRRSVWFKRLPRPIAEMYADAIADPETLTHFKDACLIDARIQQLLSRINTPESGKGWEILSGLAKQFRELMATDQAAAGLLVPEIIRTIERGVGEHYAWQEIARFVELRTGIVEKENQRIDRQSAMIPVMQVKAIIELVMACVRTRVVDAVVIENIRRDIQAIETSQTLPKL